MTHLTNIEDPKRPNARASIARVLNETPEQSWQRQQRYLKDKIIADPKATDYYTVDQLKEMGMVGVYEND